MAALDSLTDGIDFSGVDLKDIAQAAQVVEDAKDRGQEQRTELLQNVNESGTMTSGSAARLQLDLTAVHIQEIGTSVSAETAVDMTSSQAKKTEQKAG